MNLLFLVTMIIEGVFALGFIAVPALMLGPFGVDLNASAAVFARLFGTALLSFPILLWYGQRSDNPDFKTGLARALFAYYLASTPVLLFAQAAGLMNATGWSIISLHLMLLIWFSLYAFKKD